MASKRKQASGYGRLKTGDETGDLCSECATSLVIDKYGGKWTLRCQGCGREIPFISNYGDDGQHRVFK